MYTYEMVRRITWTQKLLHLIIVEGNGKQTGKSYTCIAERKEYINSVLGDFVTYTGKITETQMEKMKNVQMEQEMILQLLKKAN